MFKKMEYNILKLPNELLHLIMKNLGGCDLVAFAQTCRRFSHLCKTLRYLNFENKHSSLGISVSQLTTFIKEHLNPSLIRSCNFNGCYWIPADTLFCFISYFPNLVELHVAETELTIEDIGVNILPIYQKITKLSFTLRSGDWAAFFSRTKFNPQLLKNLKKLLSIEIIASNECELCDILSVLNRCDNLEEIVVSRAWISFEEEINTEPYDFRLRQNKKLYPRLKSLVFLAVPTGSLHQQFQFYDVREDCKLTNLWTNVLNIHCPKLKNCQLKSLSWNNCNSSSSEEIHPGIKLDGLESYWEPIKPILMKSIKAPTKLKLVNCYFDSKNFQDFCRFSPLLEELKLKLDVIQDEGGKASALVWNKESWKSLSKLKVLSLTAALIGESEAFCCIPWMMPIVQSCPLIQELEIIATAHDTGTESVATQELSAIAQLRDLKRLTLANLSVKNCHFLEEILVSCTKLETLRLKQVGPPGDPCCYIANLCKALPSARNLTTLCLFQLNVSYETQLTMLLDGLEQSCPLLSRLSLVFPSYKPWKIGKEEFKNRFIRLCEKLTNLVALFTHFRVPFTHWYDTNSVLRKRFKEKRPALRAELTSNEGADRNYYWGGGFDNGGYRSEVLPVMHSDLLTCCESKVAVFPVECQSFLRRTF